VVFVWIALGLGVSAGIGGGWLGGRVAKRGEQVAQLDRGRIPVSRGM
jgi:hypothetical protein